MTRLTSFTYIFIIFMLQGCGDTLSTSEESDLYANVDLKIISVDAKQVENTNALNILFSVPLVSEQNWDKFIDVLDSDGSRIDALWRLDKSSQSLFFTAIQPAQMYQIVIRPGLRGVNGLNITTQFKKSIKSNSLDQSVTFSSSGSILPRDLHTGLLAKSVGIEEVNISFHRVLNDKRFSAIEYLSHNSWYSLRELSSYSKFVYSGRFKTGAKENSSNKFTVDTNDIDALKQPGVYVAVMTPIGLYGISESYTYFTVSDIALQTRKYRNNITVFAQSLKSGKTLKGVKLSVVNTDNKTLKTSVTDKHGMAQLPEAFVRHENLLIAEKGDDISLLKLSSTALDLSEFDVSGQKLKAQKLFLYGPRNLYRPGETVRINGVLRNFDGKFIEPQAIKVKIFRPDDSLFESFVWKGNAHSFYEYKKTIGLNEKTGKWRLEANILEGQRFEYEFSVEDFLPERLALDIQSTQVISNSNEPITAKIKSHYLYGSPASQNSYTASLTGTVSHSPFKEFKGFHFGLTEEVISNFDTLEIAGTLTKQGEASLSFSPDFSNYYSPIITNMKASVYESGGRPITRYHNHIMLPKPSVIGIKANYKNSEGAVENPEFNLIEIDAALELSNQGKFLVKVTRDAREYFWDYDSYEGWQYKFNSTKTQVFEQIIEKDNNGVTKLKLPQSDGVHILEVVSLTTQAKSIMEYVIGQDHYNEWSLSESGRSQHTPDQIPIKLNKDSYKSGENAILSFTPSSKGVALIAVESDELLWHKTIDVSAKKTSIEVPIDASWDAHNLYASVYFVRPGSRQNVLTPKRALGIVHLPLNRDDRILQITLDTPNEWKANKHTSVKVNLGNTANTETIFTLSAVDTGALAVNNYKPLDPNTYFFAKSRYETDIRDNFRDIIELTSFNKAELRYGAGDTLQRGGSRASSEVRIIELYNGPINVDKDGNAQVNIDVPDFNGELTLVAHAFSLNKAAMVKKRVTVRSPVIAELSLPRFIATNDKSVIALDLTNLTGKSDIFSIKMSTTKGLDSQSFFKTVTIENNEQVTLQHLIEAKAVGQGTINVEVKLDDKMLVERDWKLNIRSPYPAITSIKQKIVKPGESFNLEPLIDHSQSFISFATGPDLSLQSHLSFLENYRYQCLEQTTAKAFPLLFNTAALTQADVEKLINSVQRLMALQTSSGGFSLWDNEGAEEHWLTAFAMDFLTEARAKGIVIPNEIIEAGFERLDTYVNRHWAFWEERVSNEESHYTGSYKAYSAYILAREGKLRLGTLKSLINKFSNEVASPLPHVHFSIAAGMLGNVKLMHEQLKLAQNKKRKSHYLGDFGSNIRDTAMISNLLLKHEIAEEFALDKSYELEKMLRTSTWLSTQEHVSIALLAQQLASRSQAEWKVEFIGNDTTTQLSGSKNQSVNLLSKLSTTKTLKNSGKSSLSITQLSAKHGKTLPNSMNKGLNVKRNFYNKSGRKLSVKELVSGQLIVVELLIVSDTYRPDTLVVDLLPAGWEIENQNLASIMSAKTIKVHGQSLPDLMDNENIQHQLFRDDRYVAAITTHTEQTSRLYYLARAVTPGTYHMPATYVEDMFTPTFRAIGKVDNPQIVVKPR